MAPLCSSSRDVGAEGVPTPCRHDGCSSRGHNKKGASTELALLAKEAKAQSGKLIMSAQANTVITAAMQIETAIGC